ncbi:pyridoxal-phosphate dependent enzyme [Halocola ammonii]
MRFVQKCLKCNRENDYANYACHCDQPTWYKQYRLMDMVYRLKKNEKASAIESLLIFDLESTQGILQYYFTPYRHHADDVNLKIGCTPFEKLEKLGKQWGTTIFAKDEGANPSGCFKDRETLMTALHSRSIGKEKAVIYSSGNAAASAALFAAHLRFKLVTCVAGDTYPEKVEYIRNLGSDVIRIGDDKTNYESGYRLFAELNSRDFFVENNFDNWSVRNPFRTLGDKTMAIEIVKQFSKEQNADWLVPDLVVVPTGNGSCLAGIWRGFKELKKLGLIEELPTMVSAGIKNASPVFQAFEKNMIHKPAVCDLAKVDQNDLEIGSIILAEEGYDSVEATKALIESEGRAVEVTKDDIREVLKEFLSTETELVTNQQMLPEPASLTTLAAIRQMTLDKILDSQSNAVAIITGHGAKAQQMLEKLLEGENNLKETMRSAIPRESHVRIKDFEHKKGRLIEVGKDIRELENAFEQLNKSLTKTT